MRLIFHNSAKYTNSNAAIREPTGSPPGKKKKTTGDAFIHKPTQEQQAQILACRHIICVSNQYDESYFQN